MSSLDFILAGMTGNTLDPSTYPCTCESNGECIPCGAKACPHGDPLHYHHDECPSCYGAEMEELQKWVVDAVAEMTPAAWAAAEEIVADYDDGTEMGISEDTLDECRAVLAYREGAIRSIGDALRSLSTP